MQITTFTAQAVRTVLPDATADDLAQLLSSSDLTIWVDMTGPSAEDVRVMETLFKFHPLAIEDTRNQNQRAKMEEYQDYLFFILNPIGCEGQLPVFRELDAFVGRNYLVTIHTNTEPIIDEVRQRLNRNFASAAISASYLLYVLLDTIVDAYFPVLDVVEEEIDQLENLILLRPQRDSLNRLFLLKRGLVEMWRVVWPQRDLLGKLTHHNLPFIDQQGLQYYLRDVSDHLLWIADMVNTFRDLLSSVTDLYMSTTSNQLNRVVNRLTVLTLIIGVMTVISGFYGMNFETTWPNFKDPNGVLFVIGLMFTVIATMLYVLRKLRLY